MKIISTLILLFTLSGCWDYRIELPNGYELARFYSGSSIIIEPKTSRIVVGPSTYGIELERHKQFIVGNIDTEEKSFGVPEVPDQFFILNTKNGNVQTDLNEKEYFLALRKLSVPVKELRRPNALSRY